MAHELTIRPNNFAEMAYKGERAWHGLGQCVPAGATIDDWISLAGMDWRIQRSRLRYAVSGKGPLLIDEKRHMLFRSDTHTPLSVVSAGYKVVQPADTLKFFQSLIDTHGYELETAGTLFGGKKFWALARTNQNVDLSGDKLENYLLLSTSCDGSSATEARFTSVRVVCNNTLSIASGGEAAYRVTHASEFDADAVKTSLASEYFTSFADRVEQLISKPLSNDQAETFFNELTTPSKAKDMFNLFIGAGAGSDLITAKQTAWGALNAVTEYVDHSGIGRTPNGKINNQFFGTGEKLKKEAMSLLLDE